jgi:hypothetical protein
MDQITLFNIFLVTSVLVLVTGFITYHIQRISWLHQHGRRVVAMVTSIRHETGKTDAGFSRDNYYVTATWTNPRTGKTYTFWTWILNQAPDFGQGDLVPVLIDPNNPEHYALEP